MGREQINMHNSSTRHIEKSEAVECLCELNGTVLGHAFKLGRINGLLVPQGQRLM